MIYLNVQYPKFSLAITVISALIISFIFLYLAWGILVVRWRIWAYENVENIHAFQRKAEKIYLIYTNKKLQKITEIKTAKQKARLIELEKKFDEIETDEIIKVPNNLPMETKVKTLLSTKIVFVFLVLFILSAGVYIMIINFGVFYGLLSGLLILLALWVFLKQVYISGTKFILNEQGILFIPDELVNWSEVREISGYLKFIEIEFINKYGQLETKSFDLKDMNKHYLELDDLIKAYRKKFEMNNQKRISVN